ncbi:hypothetical protein EYF80_038264 [Liparis tanakae]|uniref:Uncharacterized protein n=1 Tax=Liparis tanakae TaxID=230148 RepID=A0A4Z2GF54_9TELE|nr:hypothetical protein EYF80_038264 [Liparis tanakae]
MRAPVLVPTTAVTWTGPVYDETQTPLAALPFSRSSVRVSWDRAARRRTLAAPSGGSRAP